MKKLLYILIISTLFFGCKKYPEDETLLHLRTAKQRLWKGNAWYIKGYSVNGVDSMAYLNSYYYWRAPIEQLGLKLSKSDIIDDGGKIRFGWNHIGYNTKEIRVWNIKRLDKNILWIEQIGYNNTVYRLEFKGSQ